MEKVKTPVIQGKTPIQNAWRKNSNSRTNN